MKELSDKPLMASATLVPESSSVLPLMRYEEFLAWSDEDVHAEWVPVDNSGMGEVIVQMPPKLLHQRLVKFLSRLLDLFVHLFDLGEVALAPFEVKLQPDRSSCEPDIFFIAKENLGRLSQERFNGPPDLVIEIVSESSVKRDRSDKYGEYQAAGVREYWIIDPREGQQRADFFRLDDQGKYYLFATEESDRVKSQVLPGFWLCPEWLWQVDVLNPLMILGEIRGIPSAQMQRIQDFLIEGTVEE